MSETRAGRAAGYGAWLLIGTVVLGLGGLGLAGTALADTEPNHAPFSSGRNFNMIVVTPDGPTDGGDFGPHTPGTRTSGIQEAINHALALPKQGSCPDDWARKHIYITKGWYYCKDSVRLPWMGEQFVLNARDSNIVYVGAQGPAVQIDSLMNCVIEFGYVIAPDLRTGPVVLCQPHTPFSYAPKGVMSNSRVSFNAIVGGGNTTPDDNRPVNCVGLLLDSSSGPIICNEIFVQEVNGCHTNLILHDTPNGGSIGANHITLLFGNLCQQLARIGDPNDNSIHENTFTLNGSSGKVGVQIFAQNNLFYLKGFHAAQPGRAVIFEKNARDNVVYASNLDKGFTNNAAMPNNRMVTNGTVGFAVETPAVPPSGQELVNRQPYTVEVLILTAGKVSQWTLTDANGLSQKLDAPLLAGQRLVLDPGDKLSLVYAEAPTWRWRALR